MRYEWKTEDDRLVAIDNGHYDEHRAGKPSERDYILEVVRLAARVQELEAELSRYATYGYGENKLLKTENQALRAGAAKQAEEINLLCGNLLNANLKAVTEKVGRLRVERELRDAESERDELRAACARQLDLLAAGAAPHGRLAEAQQERFDAIEKGLRDRIAALETERAQTIERLRIECEERGDLDWPDELHLADVVDRHFSRHVAERIADLEERERLYIMRIKELEARLDATLKAYGERGIRLAELEGGAFQEKALKAAHDLAEVEGLANDALKALDGAEHSLSAAEAVRSLALAMAANANLLRKLATAEALVRQQAESLGEWNRRAAEEYEPALASLARLEEENAALRRNFANSLVQQDQFFAAAALRRLARLDALLASEEPPEDLVNRLTILSDPDEASGMAAHAWDWFRDTLRGPVDDPVGPVAMAFACPRCGIATEAPGPCGSCAAEEARVMAGRSAHLPPGETSVHQGSSVLDVFGATVGSALPADAMDQGFIDPGVEAAPAAAIVEDRAVEGFQSDSIPELIDHVMKQHQGQFGRCAFADLERIKTLATPKSNPDAIPVLSEQEFNALEPLDKWESYREAAGWMSVARDWELAVESLTAERDNADSASRARVREIYAAFEQLGQSVLPGSPDLIRELRARSDLAALVAGGLTVEQALAHLRSRR